MLLKEHGLGLATVDMARAWLRLLPAAATWPAERTVYRTLLQGTDETFAHGALPSFDPAECSDSPYNNWIGGQIRADMCGWWPRPSRAGHRPGPAGCLALTQDDGVDARPSSPRRRRHGQSARVTPSRVRSRPVRTAQEAPAGFLEELKALELRRMLVCVMASDVDVLSALLTQLDRFARAPMTGQERELRAKSVLGPTLEARYVARAITSEGLAWNATKASEHEVPTELWLQAVEAAGLPTCTSVAELLEAMHRADSIADMMKAGYRGLAGWAPRGKG